MRVLLFLTALALTLHASVASADDSCLDLSPSSPVCAPSLQNYWNARPHLSKKEGLVTPLFSLFDEDGRDYGDVTLMMKGILGVSLPNLDGPVGFKLIFHFSTGG